MMSLSNKIRLSAFVLTLVAVVTAIWHFTWLGYCNGSNFCLILAIATIAFGFDAIKYFEEYFMAKPNKAHNKTRTLMNIALKIIVLVVMLYTSATFSAKDVVIKHPTFAIEFLTYLTWFVIYSVAQLALDKYLAKKATQTNN